MEKTESVPVNLRSRSSESSSARSELRERVIALLVDGQRPFVVAEMFGISRSTICRWGRAAGVIYYPSRTGPQGAWLRKMTREPKQTLEDAFWASVDRSGDCWVWTGAQSTEGYGVFDVGGRQEKAHRFSAQLAGMQIDGMVVCHHCDNPPCVRPGHLFVGTPNDNIQDMVKKDRQAQGETHGARLHPERFCSLTEEEVIAVRSAVDAGETHERVAERFGVSRANVGMIVQRKTWKHI